MPRKVVSPDPSPSTPKQPAQDVSKESADSPSKNSLEHLFERSRELSTKLGAVTDALNDSLLRAEKTLAGLKLGVTASVLIAREELNGSTDWCQYLRFGKHSDQWRLLVESGPEDFPEDFSTTILVNASRETRLLAARRLPDLLQAMVQAADAQIEEVVDTTSSVDTLIASWEKARNAQCR